MRLRPTQAVADILRLIKANSSKWVNETFRQGPTFAWQEGYAAFTVSQSQVPRILTYIRGQEEHHRKHDFRRELVTLLRRNGIPFDERDLSPPLGGSDDFPDHVTHWLAPVARGPSPLSG